MSRIILNKKQLQDLIFENRYKVNPKTKFLSRCIDGRYENKLKVKSQKSKTIEEIDLPALAIPGADIGELALILATANNFGFDIDKEKVYQSLLEVIGGEKNFQYIIDDNFDYFREIKADLKAYDLSQDDLDFLEKKLIEIKKNGQAEGTILNQKHSEAAVLIIQGSWGVYPEYFLTTSGGRERLAIFIYHQSLADERHRILAKKLLENKAVELYPGCDEDYLYQVISEEAENHFFEFLKKIRQDLPIFNVKFNNDGSFILSE